MRNHDYTQLKRKIDAIINNQGDFGISASQGNSGYYFAYNEDKKFDMASTYKIPLAIRCLKLVEAGTLKLDQIVQLSANDQRPRTGLPAPLITSEKDRLNYSLKELLDLMLQYSDNTATDAIFKLVGGPAAVMKTMQELGINDLSVDNTIYQFLTEQIGVGHLISEDSFSIAKFAQLENSLPKEYIKAAEAKYDQRDEDTSTPKAMGNLLTKLVQGKLLNKDSTNLLLDIMSDCKTFRGRIQGMLPKDLRIHRKTGTMSHIANDVAIIDLPQGPFILVIFSCHLYTDSASRDKFVALIAKAIYDDFIGIAQ